MTDHKPLLDRYLPHRRLFEVGFWVLFFGLQATINSVIVNMDVDRVRLDFARWEPWVWEWSSNLVLMALVPVILAIEARFPLRYGELRRSVGAHVLGSIAVSVLHVVGMVALRHLAYGLLGGRYDFGYWPRELAYEYLKDWRTYATVLLIVAAYRLLLLRLQGEARLLDEPDDGPPVEPVARPDRFLVRKLGKEFLIAASEIEYLQASGNYVNLRVRGRDYPLRSTMAALEPRLDAARFVRVHRSYIVNLDCLLEIEPLDTGDARLSMRDGTKVPCSRRYRAAIRG